MTTQEFLQQLENLKNLFLPDVYELVVAHAETIEDQDRQMILQNAMSTQKTVEESQAIIEQEKVAVNDIKRTFQQDNQKAFQSVEGDLQKNESAEADALLNQL